MKTALQANRRTPPAGFEERSNMQILQLTAETKPGRRMPRVAVVLCVILAVMTLATALAATVDVFNSRLHAFWPEAAEFLMPVNASCESEGIRMEVLSAVVKGDKAHVTFSLQDLEGDRLNEYSLASFSDLAFPTKAQEEEDYLPISTIAQLSYDPETKTAVFAQEFDYDASLVNEDYQIPLYIPCLSNTPYDQMDLKPLLEEYGKEVKTAQAPDNARALMEKPPVNRTILDPAANLKIRLNDYTELSGIGWIDGQLHAQIHYLRESMKTYDDGTLYSPAFCQILMLGADGVSPLYSVYRDHPEDVNFGWQWDDNGDWFSDWEEFIFPCTPAEVRDGTLQALTTYYEKAEAIDGNWYVKIPLRMIQFENTEK